jgi:hypothetical protein
MSEYIMIGLIYTVVTDLIAMAHGYNTTATCVLYSDISRQFVMTLMTSMPADSERGVQSHKAFNLIFWFYL